MADRYEPEKWKRPGGFTLWRVLDRASGEYVREPGTEDKPLVFASESSAESWVNREHAASH